MNASVHKALLEIIIPIKDRVELMQCVRSLTVAVGNLAKIIVCDGGSTIPQCVEYLRELERQDNVRVLRFPTPGFNKSMLINQGIAQAKAEFLLISDADILWNEATMDALLNKVLSDDKTICCVRDVKESQPDSVALKRDRYTYKLTINDDVAIVDIVPISDHLGEKRPGCGLICARRITLITLGGYKEIFTGWGWEDQDLLIRARLFGIKICTEGVVMHLSHDDAARNKHHGNIKPMLTRNRNIIACLKSLASGVLLGDLQIENAIAPHPKIIRVRLPESLANDS